MRTFRVKVSRKRKFEKPVNVVQGEKVTCMEDSNPSGAWFGWTLCKTVDNEGWIWAFKKDNPEVKA